ncbi:MAG: DNA translocase FtsK 4TM domain-containing protein [Bdellovibrionales bacterium]|nr:DNA translocase FtsK 4TM domain-containing protein [Bdellovibrionales bacterium]
MSRFKQAIANVFERDSDADVRPKHDDRTARELKGSIFTLLTLFVLVALTSYVPIDTYNLKHNQWDQVNNLGGIVGAWLAEYLLGYLGVMGYGLLGLTSFLSFLSFSGTSMRKNMLLMLGGGISAALGAMACFVLFHQTVSELSPLLGGIIGKTGGAWLYRYFNSTGAGLLLGGGFLVTLMLTTDLSLRRLFRPLVGNTFEDYEEIDLSNEEEEEENDDEAEEEEKIIARAPAPAKKPQSKAKPAKKKKSKKAAKKNAADDDEDLNEEVDALDDEGDADEGSSEQSAEAEFQEVIPYRETYKFPSLRSLQNYDSGAKKPTRSEIRDNTRKICEHLVSFNITGEVETVSVGPVINTYEFKPSAGVKLKSIANVQEDLGIVMGTPDLRIVAPIPGKTVVGIEVPRPKSEIISLKQILSSKEFADKKIRIPVALGKSTDGQALIGDLAAMPHLLVAGATGSGKSVFVNSLITSFLYRMSPQQLRMILIDPKMLELNVFEGLPHLISNIVTRPQHAVNALNWAVMEMENRYNLMAEYGSKNIDSYNSSMKSAANKMPYIVIVVDELADLMLTSGGEVEEAITRLAQKARAAGIHLVIATQRPSTDVVTGLIKANIPSRLAFKVPSSVDSRTVLDTSGAEDLIGRGDSLMILPGKPIQRIHGCFTSEEDLQKLTKGLSKKSHEKLYIDFSKAPK